MALRCPYMVNPHEHCLMFMIDFFLLALLIYIPLSLERVAIELEEPHDLLNLYSTYNVFHN